MHNNFLPKHSICPNGYRIQMAPHHSRNSQVECIKAVVLDSQHLRVPKHPICREYRCHLIIVGAQILHVMALANMQMHQIAHMYLVNKKLKQEPRSAKLTGAAGMMEVCSGGIWKHSWVIWGPSRAIWDDLGVVFWLDWV